ncbi:calcium-binding protein [Azospirillum sp. sgz301742]
MLFGRELGESYGDADGPRYAVAAAPPAPFASFSAKPVDYYENRADGGYAWEVKYGLGFDGSAFTVQTKIHLTGDDPGAYKQVWESGIEQIWNNKFSLSDSSGQYAIRFDVQFVDSGADYDVAVHNTAGGGDMLNWYLDTAWGPSYQDELAAHEYGHMLGAFDEYAGGATYQGQTATGTIMSDLTPTITSNYMYSIDSYAEQFTGRSFSIVPGGAPVANPPAGVGTTGTTGNDTLAGGAGKDTLSGLAGDDLINGWENDDWLYGGVGNDTLNGGAGADRLWGDRGNDLLTGGDGADRFCFASGSGADRITDFNYAAGDRIQLASGQRHKVTSDSRGFAVVDLGHDDRVTLENIRREQVNNSWFVTG